MKFSVLILLGLPLFLMAQTEDEPKFTAQGYVKDMVTFNFAGEDSTLIDNLIHHRLNLAWFPDQHWRVKLEFRNRIFFGDQVRAIPNYGSFIDVNNDYFDWSLMPVNEENLILHTMIDRAFVQYNKNDWEVTLGRQRINWGVNLAWNPNDLFNSYSFFDFDYEERPGSDALRIKKYTGFASEVEFAIKAADRFEDLTSAFKYQVNKWNYDVQFIAGVMKNNFAVGSGWAGNIKNAGFKGEFTYLRHLENEVDGLIGSITVDYSFSNSLYLNGSVLYNGYGAARPDFSLVNTNSSLDIRSLSPYKWSTFAQASFPATPLLNTGLSAIVFPSDGSVFINPYLTFSLRQNLDLDLISQLFFSDDVHGNYGSQASMVFTRVKFSY